jgi:hypothetical protein
MPDAYVIEVSGRTAGIVARDSQNNSFNFYSAVPRFNAIEGRVFPTLWQPSVRRACLRNTEASRGAAKRNIQRTSRNKGSQSRGARMSRRFRGGRRVPGSKRARQQAIFEQVMAPDITRYFQFPYQPK